MDGKSPYNAINSNSLFPSSNHHNHEMKSYSAASILDKNNQTIDHSNSHANNQLNGSGSSKMKVSHDIRNTNKNHSSSSYCRNSTNSHRPHLHYHRTTTNVFGVNKMRNNIGHKVSQTKRIQLSTAAKRCKSIDNKSNVVDNNNSNEADDSDNCKTTFINALGNRQIIADNSSANNSSTRSTESPTLVRVKTWYTEQNVNVVLSQHLA